MKKVTPSFTEFTSTVQENLNEAKNHKDTERFMLWLANFGPNFIQEVWADDKNIQNHLQKKWDNSNREGYDRILWFYFQVGDKQKLIDWVIKNKK
jgi:hypothetical protein